MRTRALAVLAGVAVMAGIATIAIAFSSEGAPQNTFVGKLAAGDPDAQPGNSQASAGLGPTTYEAYLNAQRAYPALEISPAIAANAQSTFEGIAAKDAKAGDPRSKGHKWEQYGPTENATEPGVLAFSGATNNTASRTTALAIDPDCGKDGCRVWIGASGGGVWRTDDVLAGDPVWKQLKPEQLDQNSVGVLTLDPTDKTNKTIYLGTGEPNRCSSGCEAGVGIYKSTNGGNKWQKLAAVCVSNATYACVTAGQNAFLGRGIRAIVIDPNDANHIFVGSAQAVRGLSHVIGNGGTTRLEPAANEPGLYESHDGGATFTEVWDGAKPDVIAGAPGSFGITDVGLDPLDSSVVYAAGFDAGLWRRDAGAAATAFSKIFAAQFNQGLGIDRLMFDTTVKSGHTRMYLTEGTQPATNAINDPLAANFWRVDNANQPAATLLSSQGAACTPPDPATHAFPATYNGWQCLTSQTAGNPYFPTTAFCTQQCWYDQNVYTPAGLPDTVYVIGSMSYGEQPCNTNGVGCGNGRSNGRAVIYSNTAGDPDAASSMRTFTDLTMDSTINHPPWCAFAPYFDNGCENAPNGIHPDEHVIGVNPANPTQIFEGSDGGMIRTSGQFADVSSQCDSQFRNGGAPLPSTSGSYTACKRLLSRVPTLVEHIDRKYSSTLQFINVAINPSSTCEVMGGTQDNGTWSNNDGCDNKTWHQVVYGDGGNAGYDATNGAWRFNEFTSGFSDSNFRNGDPEKWVITSAPVVNSGEGPAFYWPQISDPNPVPGSHPIFSGAKHVWRTWAFGAGHAGNVPQDKTPDIAGYEANCPEFVVSGAQQGCGDYRPLGGPYCDGLASTTTIPSCINQPGDLTGTVYGTDRGGGSISWISRDAADHGTIWVATSAGRIFVTHNGDAADPATTTWHRIDSSTSGGSPTRFPSGIYVDPDDTGHAWISYSGYNAVTPSTPGHVFDVHENGTAPGSGTFTNLNVESGTSAFPTPTNDGDLPVSDVVRDDSSNTLYVGTDFGVLRGDDDGTGGWHVTAGMPRYEVMHLEIQPSSRVATCAAGKKCKPVLYAATHSQGIWRMKLK
jgi:hypothetical protein